MAKSTLASRPQDLKVHQRIAIVASLYNHEFVDAMVTKAHAELETILPDLNFPIFRVPGAFEIPTTVERLCRTREFSSIVALGVIIRGETAHADLIASSITTALQEISVRHVLPVIHEVLLVDNEAQARERCLGDKINRGVEAARSAAGMADLFGQLATAYPMNP